MFSSGSGQTGIRDLSWVTSFISPIHILSMYQWNEVAWLRGKRHCFRSHRFCFRVHCVNTALLRVRIIKKCLSLVMRQNGSRIIVVIHVKMSIKLLYVWEFNFSYVLLVLHMRIKLAYLICRHFSPYSQAESLTKPSLSLLKYNTWLIRCRLSSMFLPQLLIPTVLCTVIVSYVSNSAWTCVYHNRTTHPEV